jgi:hypothetical protein
MKFALPVFAVSALAAALVAAPAQAQSFTKAVNGATGSATVSYQQGGTLSLAARIAISECFNAPTTVTPSTYRRWTGPRQASFRIPLSHNMTAPSDCTTRVKIVDVFGQGSVGKIDPTGVDVTVSMPQTARVEPDANATYLDMSALNSIQVGNNLLTLNVGGSGGKPSLFNERKWDTHKTVKVTTFGSAAFTTIRTATDLTKKVGFLHTYESAAFVFMATHADFASVQVGSNGGPLWFIKVWTKATKSMPSVQQLWIIDPNSGDLVFSRVS